ncbi:MAG: tRNA (adenosine(37)-N6)-threonylcarbamoyltransferase complex dimerization subunit type 1 TsaB [Solirubrobacterales bacterium]
MSEPEESVIAFDSATDGVAVGLARAGEVLAETLAGADAGERPRHASVLLEAIEAAVEAGGGWERVGRIGIGVGPGSYTGMRIGIATGRALAQARELPAVGVGTLTALALGIAGRAEARGRVCLAVGDARRSEIFAQLHDDRGTPLSDPAVLAPDRLAGWLAEIGGKPLSNGVERPLAAGSGALRFARELEVAGVKVLPAGDPAHRLAPRHLCTLTAEGAGVAPSEIRPVYLREPDAKRWLERDRS